MAKIIVKDWMQGLWIGLFLGGSIFYFFMPTSMATNGKILVTINDFLCIIMWCYFVFIAFSQRKAINKVTYAILWAWLLLGIFYAGLLVYRFFNDLEYSNSLYLARSTFLSLIPGLFLFSRLWDYKKVLYIFSYFNLFICSCYIVRAYMLGSLRTDVFYNVLVCGTVLLSLMPFIFLNYIYAQTFRENIVNCIGICFDLFFILCSGSRVLVITGLLATILLCVILFVFFKKKLAIYLLTLLCTLVMLIFCWCIDLYETRIFIARGTNIESVHTFFSSDGKSNSNEPDSDNDGNSDNVGNNLKDQEQLGIQQSDSIRSLAWKRGLEELSANPWIGGGNVTVFLDGHSNGRVPLHNFALEYGNAYGIIGFAIWLSWLCIPVIFIFKSIIVRHYKPNKVLLIYVVLAATSLSSTFLIAFTQGLTSFIPNMMIWISLGTWYNILQSHIEEVKTQ